MVITINMQFSCILFNFFPMLFIHVHQITINNFKETETQNEGPFNTRTQNLHKYDQELGLSSTVLTVKL